MKAKILYGYLRNFGGALRKFDRNIIDKNITKKTKQILEEIPQNIFPGNMKDFVGLMYFRLVKAIKRID